MRIDNQNRIKGWRLSLLLAVFGFILFSITSVKGSNPSIKVSTAVIAPRISMLDEEEATHWRTLINYNHQIRPSIAIVSLIEYGSENDHFQNPLRIHQFFTRIQRRNYSLRMGRLSHWNSMIPLRVDGLEINIHTSHLGSLKLLGGTKSVTDFHDSDTPAISYVLTSWSRGRVGNNITCSYWVKNRDEEVSSFVGISYHTSFFKIGLNSSFAWDISESRIQYLRSRFHKKLGRYRIAVGYRQKRYSAFEAFSWSEKSFEIAPLSYFEIVTNISRQFIWINRYTHRFNDTGADYIRSTIQYNPIQLSLFSGRKGDTEIVGGLIAVSFNRSRPWSYGGSLAVNTLDYGDTAEPKNSSGLYYWLAWQPNQKILIRLFGRYYNNQYYKIDGRGGLVVNVAL